jgi:thioredoxin 2
MSTTASTIVVCPNCGKKNRVPVAARGFPQCSNCHHALPWIVEASDMDFADVAEQATLPVLLDLWAPWCGPCRMVSPILESLAQQLAGQVKLVKVNVDESPAVAQRFQARSIPMLLVLHHGRVVAKQVGAAPEQVLRPWLEQAIADAATPGAGPHSAGAATPRVGSEH